VRNFASKNSDKFSKTRLKSVFVSKVYPVSNPERSRQRDIVTQERYDTASRAGRIRRYSYRSFECGPFHLKHGLRYNHTYESARIKILFDFQDKVLAFREIPFIEYNIQVTFFIRLGFDTFRKSLNPQLVSAVVAQEDVLILRISRA
jgi:hypothetical protein